MCYLLKRCIYILKTLKLSIFYRIYVRILWSSVFAWKLALLGGLIFVVYCVSTDKLITLRDSIRMTPVFAVRQRDALIYAQVIRSEEQYQELVGRKALDNVENVMRQNSDILPEKSAFGGGTSSICEGSDAANCAPKFGIQHTMLYALFCYLYDPEKFVAAGRLIHKEQFGARFCKEGYEAWTLDFPAYAKSHFNRTETEILDEWHPFVMVRDPLDRFISAYVDKCIRRPFSKDDYCNGCHKNMTCFIETEFHRIRQSATVGRKTYEDHHFLPQSWECNFEQHFDRYEKIRYDSVDLDGNLDRLRTALANRGVVDAQLDYIRADVGANRTLHSTAGTRVRDFLERRLRGSAYLMEYIVRMYYWDFKLFGYAMPEIRYRQY